MRPRFSRNWRRSAKTRGSHHGEAWFIRRISLEKPPRRRVAKAPKAHPHPEFYGRDPRGRKTVWSVSGRISQRFASGHAAIQDLSEIASKIGASRFSAKREGINVKVIASS